METSRISATTLKLIELASIMEKLMRKNKPGRSWSRDAHSFYARLAENYSEGLLDDLLLVRSFHFLLYDASVDWLASLFRAGRGRGRAKDSGQNGQQNCLSRSPPSESSLTTTAKITIVGQVDDCVFGYWVSLNPVKYLLVVIPNTITCMALSVPAFIRADLMHWPRPWAGIL